jgi:uncharacterized membrane protein
LSAAASLAFMAMSAANRFCAGAKNKMRKIHIYLIGVALVGGVMAYFPDIFRDPIYFCLGALFLILLRLFGEKFGKD